MKPVLRWLRSAWPQSVAHQVAIVKAYKARFTNDEAPDLEDLRAFCNIYDTTERETPHASAHAEGRRQVYLHIVNMLNLNLDELKPTEKVREDDRDSSRPGGIKPGDNE